MKIKRILLSRKKKEKKDNNIQKYIEKALRECIGCEFNSKNAGKVTFKKRFMIFLSNTLTRVYGRQDEDVYGNCTVCSGCSVYYKTQEIEFEECPKNKWKKYESKH